MNRWWYFAALVLLGVFGGYAAGLFSDEPRNEQVVRVEVDGGDSVVAACEVDCVGDACDRCWGKESCDGHQDCASGRCEQGRCVVNPFITVWNTAERQHYGAADGNGTEPSGTDENSVHLPLVEKGNYYFRVDWGDGTHNIITRGEQPEATHRYAESGLYTVIIEGIFEGWSFEVQELAVRDSAKLVEIKDWGVFRIGVSELYPPQKVGWYFLGAKNLMISATDILNLEGTTSLSNMFVGCEKIEKIPSMNQWDVSSITDMTRVFGSARAFNQDISGWDVSSVTNMSNLFDGAYSFNQPIGEWDVSSVTDMTHMFLEAHKFNQDIGAWDVSSVTSMMTMFAQAYQFNQDISRWDVSSVTTMHGMFQEAQRFNQPIGAWNVSSVSGMSWMFLGASSFDQNIGGWNISSVRDMSELFESSMSSLSTTNYDALLMGWASRRVQPGVSLGVGDARYSGAATAARSILINGPNAWVISDGGQE